MLDSVEEYSTCTQGQVIGEEGKEDLLPDRDSLGDKRFNKETIFDLKKY